MDIETYFNWSLLDIGHPSVGDSSLPNFRSQLILNVKYYFNYRKVTGEKEMRSR